MVLLPKLKKSTRAAKKYMVVFPDGTKTHFGAKGFSDFTKHRDNARKQRYIARHSATQDWTDPKAAGTLARFVLWNKPTVKASFNDYLRRFGFR